MEHLIKLEKLFNTRDLGGYKTQDNLVIKNKRLIRSGSLFKATNNDILKLINEYNLKYVIDFRNSLEVRGEKDNILDGINYLHIPVLEAEVNGITFPERKETLEGRMESLYTYLKSLEPNPKEKVKKLYLKFIKDKEAINAYKKMFQVLLNLKENESVLYHCSAGKDRAGIATAYILMSLGVSKETIIEDYLSTNDYIFEYGFNKTLNDFKECGYDISSLYDSLKSLFSVDKDYILVLFNYIETNYVSYEEFLIDKFNISNEDILNLRKKFLN